MKKIVSFVAKACCVSLVMFSILTATCPNLTQTSAKDVGKTQTIPPIIVRPK